MIDGNAWMRMVVYAVVMFLILVVYVGQRHDNAAAILKEAWPKTLKWTGYTILLVVIMQVLFWLFV